MNKVMILLMAGLGMTAMAHADTIVLQSGQRIEGQVLQRTDLDVVVDAGGPVETFYLGEIATIDGKAVKISAPPQEAKAAAPHFGDEQDSLARFMDKRSGNQPKTAAVAAKASKPLVQAPPKPVTKAAAPVVPPEAEAGHAPSATPTPNVIPTADGGIIVVTPSKITKYDKDLHAVKEVDLNSAAAKSK